MDKNILYSDPGFTGCHELQCYRFLLLYITAKITTNLFTVFGYSFIIYSIVTLQIRRLVLRHNATSSLGPSS